MGEHAHAGTDESTPARGPAHSYASARRAVWIVACVAVLVLAVAGCGKRGSTGGTGGDGGSSGGGSTSVGLVTDLGGLGDKSFNKLANDGLERAKSELGVSGTVIESKSASDYETNLGQLAQQKKSLVIGVGFLMSDAVKNVAGKVPKQNFALVDYDVSQIGSPKNVRGLIFKEQEAGYLVGALAGMVEQDGTLKGLNSQHVVSVVGGQQIPPVDKYIAGYQAGVKAYCKDCKVLVDYSQDFIDQSKCQDRATKQLSQGSDIIFQVAGGCGAGALSAAKDKGIWGIGVDADQSYLGPHILTSALKKVDVAVFETIKSVKDGSFEGGTNGEYGLAQDGVGYGTISPAASAYQAKLDQVVADVKAGKVTIPTDVAK